MSTIEFQDRLAGLASLLEAFAYSLTKNGEDAKDLLQETSYKALKYKDKYRADTNFKAWVMTIMKNIFINEYRRKNRANTIFDNTQDAFYLNSGNSIEYNRADSNILMKELTALIDELDETLKTPFFMHYQGYKYHEIADCLDLPIGTVKSRIFFARKFLKEKIGERYEERIDTGC